MLKHAKAQNQGEMIKAKVLGMFEGASEAFCMYIHMPEI